MDSMVIQGGNDHARHRALSIPVGLEIAVDRDLRRKNDAEFDFDQQKQKKKGELTFSQWAQCYLELVMHKKSLDRDKRSCKMLGRFLVRCPCGRLPEAREWNTAMHV